METPIGYYPKTPRSQILKLANRMTRYGKLMSKSIEETAAWIVDQNLTDKFCKSDDCNIDWENGSCTDESATKCCVKWLMEPIEKDSQKLPKEKLSSQV